MKAEIYIRILKTLRIKPFYTWKENSSSIIHANQLYCLSLSEKLEFRIKGVEDKVDIQLINIPSDLLFHFKEDMNNSDLQFFITSIFHQKNKEYFILKEGDHYEIIPPTIKEILKNEKNSR